MAIFYQQEINPGTRLGVWKIEEPESFFLNRVPLKRDVTHPHKRLQHLAGRFLLPFLFPGFPLEEILIADTRKPFLFNEAYHFSISHCGDFAAVIASKNHRVGIDLEKVSEKVERIAHKFMTDEEWEVLSSTADQIYNRQHLLTILWSAKEAVFKWYGFGQMDFRRDIRLIGATNNVASATMRLQFKCPKASNPLVSVETRFVDGLVLAFAVTTVG